MSSAIASNRLKFPTGYHRYISVPTYGEYFRPWNGYNNGVNSPGASIQGAVSVITIAAAPADSAISTFTDSLGRAIVFQFIYPATVPGANVIPVDLPNGGASTADEVATAFLTALQSPALDSEGDTVFLPWEALQTGAAELTINWTVAGDSQGITVPAGITQETESDSAFSLTSTLPGRVGPLGAVLPGV